MANYPNESRPGKPNLLPYFYLILDSHECNMCYRVWSKFQAKKNDGSLLKLRIQDLPKSKFEDAVEILMRYFVKEEFFHIIAGVSKNHEAIEEARAYITEGLQGSNFHTVICCEDNDGDKVGQIVGVSSIYLVVKGAKPAVDVKPKTKEVQTLLNLQKDVCDMYNQIEDLKLPYYYDCAGIVVDPEFRKLGIATEFLKIRGLVCMATDVPVAVALMTSINSQKGAEKANWRSVLDVDLKNLGQQNGVVSEDLGVRKLMIWKHQTGT